MFHRDALKKFAIGLFHIATIASIVLVMRVDPLFAGTGQETMCDCASFCSNSFERYCCQAEGCGCTFPVGC